MAAAKLREDPITEKFLQYFYDSCINTLYKPLLDLSEYKKVTGDAPLLALFQL